MFWAKVPPFKMQQKTSVIPVNHPVRALTGLAKQMALPHEFGPERFPSFPALERTALMAFNYPTTAALAANTPVKFMCSRQATYPVWGESTVNGIATLATYKAEISAATAATSVIFDSLMLSDWAVSNRIASGTAIGVAGANPPLVPYQLFGVDNSCGNSPFVYVPNNYTMSHVIAALAPVTNAATTVVTYEIWSSPGEVYRAAGTGSISAGNTGGLGNGPAAVVGPCWVRPVSFALNFAVATSIVQQFTVSFVVSTAGVTYATSAVTMGQITPVGGGVTGFGPICWPVEFANSTLPWYSTRTTAAAFLGTNVSQILNKGGTVLAGRVAPQVFNPWLVTSSYINALHPAEKAFLPLETGVYTYAPPSTDLADFWDYTLNTSGGAPAAPVYRLDNTSLVNIMFLTATAVTEQLAINVDWHIEFRTSSALFPIGLSAVTLETLHQAQIALASVGFFFENPEHKQILSRVIAAAKKYGPSVLSIVSPMAGRFVKDYIMPRQNKSQMKPTSAAGSGMLGKKAPKKIPAKPKAKAAGKKKK